MTCMPESKRGLIKVVRELIPHIGPSPILIPLRLFLEFPRIMLPGALRGRCVAEESINMAGIVECEMKIALFVLFSIFIWINRHQGKEVG